MASSMIEISGAREHNLKDLALEIPRNQLVVITGLSGSGKSSLAFDTIYAEGQRRYVESLSAYARQFLDRMQKPDVDRIDGLSPAISIEQKTAMRTPRSTVGTVTEIYDYMRVLYARVGTAYSPVTGKPIRSMTVTQMVDRVMQLDEKRRFYLLAPVVRGRKGEYRKEIEKFRKDGFQRLRVDGTIYMIDEVPPLDKTYKHDIDVLVDRLVRADGMKARLAESLETALRLSDGIALVETLTETGQTHERLLLSEKFSCAESGFSLPEIAPRLFSFNSPYGACPGCEGIGTRLEIDPELVVPDENLSLRKGALAPWTMANANYRAQILEALARTYDFSLDVPWRELGEKAQKLLLYGTGRDALTFEFVSARRLHRVHRPFEGVVRNLERRLRDTDSQWIREEIGKFQTARFCDDCNGGRLKPEALCVRVAQKSIVDLSRLSIEDALDWFGKLDGRLNDRERLIASGLVKEIVDRLTFLNDVGLSYLTLDRASATLSGGESQRIRLASQIGSGLTGVLYVLDEPSIGLHQRDNARLLQTLFRLRDLGNSVLVVEHDEEAIRAADHVIDIGPEAGVHGGEVVAAGTPTAIRNQRKSITGAYLSGRLRIDVPSKRRPIDPERMISIKGAAANNLRSFDVDFPLGCMIAVTGVSGSGKSSLVHACFFQAIRQHLAGKSARHGAYREALGLELLDKVINIDQSPIGRTPRSNPATYVGAFGPIREWFAALPEARARGYGPGRFSFNVKGGRCEACHGGGVTKIEMHFLPDIFVTCDQCQGQRYGRETREIVYKGKNIAQVLEMTVEEGLDFFAAVPAVRNKLAMLDRVGLGYVKIGQPATTLSGGEAQRVKLSRELSRRSTGRTLYLLDEPTTGLHFHDVARLIDILHALVSANNTVVVIEHNLEVIKVADHIIDLGPDGGNGGGQLVMVGTPEVVAASGKGYTSAYLNSVLGDDRRHPPPQTKGRKVKGKTAGKYDAANKKKRAAVVKSRSRRKVS